MISKWTFFLVVIIFYSCKSEDQTKATAASINDSVIRLTKNFSDTTKYNQAMSLIREAIRIDSSYLKSFKNKLYFEEVSGRFDSAFETLVSMIKLKPDSAELYLKAGVYKDIIGDTVVAQEYYRRSLPRFSILMDTLKNDNPERSNIMNMMFMNIILMGQKDILRKAALEEGSDMDSIMIYPILRKSREDLLSEGRKKYFR